MTPSVAASAARVVTLRDGMIISDKRQTARQAIRAGRFAAPHPRLPGQVAQPQSSNFAAARRRSARADARFSESDSAPLTFAIMALRAAARALARNKLRSALTMLGMFIGVAALIAMVAVGQGASEAVEEQIAEPGHQFVRGDTRRDDFQRRARRLRQRLDADGGRRRSDHARTTGGRAGQLSRSPTGAGREQPTELEHQHQRRHAHLPPIRNWPVAAGRKLTEEDERPRRSVCLLGQTVVTTCSASTRSGGFDIRVKNVQMRVIGVFAAKGQSDLGQDQDDVVLIPFCTAERKVLGVAAPPATVPRARRRRARRILTRRCRPRVQSTVPTRPDQSFRQPAQTHGRGAQYLRPGQEPDAHSRRRWIG